MTIAKYEVFIGFNNMKILFYWGDEQILDSGVTPYILISREIPVKEDGHIGGLNLLHTVNHQKTYG